MLLSVRVYPSILRKCSARKFKKLFPNKIFGVAIKMKIALLLVALIACTYALSEREYNVAFGKFKEQYNKNYETEAEHKQRFSIFRSNLDFINSHDAEAKGEFNLMFTETKPCFRIHCCR
jgi:hypothetical protein